MHIILYKSVQLIGIPQVTLTSNPAVLDGPICPTTVQMTCVVKDLPFLRWFINGTQAAAYTEFEGNITNSNPRDLDSSLPGFRFQIISARQESSDSDDIDATSVMTTNITRLMGLVIQCGSSASRRLSDSLNVTNVTVHGK